MSTEVLAIGPFHRSLIPHLEYPPECYERTHEGSTVLETVFDTPEGSSRSRELAGCFGIDPWDFDAHALDAEAADLDRLQALFPGEEDRLEKFLALRRHGFRFYFRPHG